MTMQDDLHRETKVMPVKEHCAFLSKQYLLMSQAPRHPNHGLMETTSERDMRRTLAMEFKEEVGNATNFEHPKWMKRGNILLHSRSVRGVLEAAKPNKVPNDKPPPIADEERKLGRETRAKLAQLRAGYSKMLCSYQSRIDQSVRDECPDCDESRRRNLFNCKTKPIGGCYMMDRADQKLA